MRRTMAKDFGEDEFLLPPLRTKDEILVLSQKAKNESLLTAITTGKGQSQKTKV